MTSSPDPRQLVEAPVHRALDFLVVRGAASFAVGVLAVLVTVMAPEGMVHQLGHAALPGVLLFVVLARAFHAAAARGEWIGAGAWARAAEVNRPETQFAALVAVAVPVSWAAGLGAVLVRHASDPPAAAAILGVWLPLAAALWFLATIAWAGDCRERLARAHEAAEARFRAYWAGVSRPS
jgi:hypothetical protein